jgi:hypothetical protein
MRRKGDKRKDEIGSVTGHKYINHKSPAIYSIITDKAREYSEKGVQRTLWCNLISNSVKSYRYH